VISSRDEKNKRQTILLILIKRYRKDHVLLIYHNGALLIHHYNDINLLMPAFIYSAWEMSPKLQSRLMEIKVIIQL